MRLMNRRGASVRIKPPNAEDTERIMKPLSPEQLRLWIDERRLFNMLDVREPWEYGIVHLDMATLVPLRTLGVQSPAFDKNIPVVVYCHHGVRSLTGCKILEHLGYEEVYNLTGGIDDYARRVKTDMVRY